MSRISLDEKWWAKFFNRLTWVLIFVVVLFSLIFGTKLLGLHLETDIKLSFESVLTFVIAFFSLGLSIMFYFKTEETSNRFYDNTYKFTSEISNVLATIRAEFGERLKHLDSGYSKIADAVSPPADLVSNLEKIKKDLEDKSIGKALSKEEEKDEDALRSRIGLLQKRFETLDKNINEVLTKARSPIRDRALSYTRNRVVDKLGGREILRISDDEIALRIKDLIKENRLPVGYVEDLKTLSFIDKNKYLSQEFIDHLRKYAHRV